MEKTWYKLANLATNKFKDVENVSGIYFVRWSRDGKPVAISRLGGVDQKGILYVGSAKNLKKRVKRLWRGINQQGRHTIGKTIIFCKVFELINLDEYEISWEEARSPEKAIGLEWTAIKLYADKYREPPPLNLQLRREMFIVLGIGKWGKSRFAYEEDKFVKAILG